MPPNMEEDITTYNRLKKGDPKKALAFIIEWMKTPEAQEAFGYAAKVEFPEKQREWFKNVLAANTDVRWTFVFPHEPVWDNPSDSFKEIDEAIHSRNYTFFAGHTHYYDYDVINGHEYITVGSAGAAFVHDGAGNVDMLTPSDELDSNGRPVPLRRSTIRTSRRSSILVKTRAPTTL